MRFLNEQNVPPIGIVVYEKLIPLAAGQTSRIPTEDPKTFSFIGPAGALAVNLAAIKPVTAGPFSW